ncbi:GNAT family N-acetyltransferase [Actinoplanes sp. NBRC 103695]|uniref:GNAT family N-acetyltransferase n=1 Tax=Actinoplanes sp. NBRC 103695 TaxID=3032202 RepID=UPI0025571941|nr:GNAT family N-acetyltransferase [Actinoplanes sp. NBRC 103695]
MDLVLVELGRPAGARLWAPFTHDEASAGFNQDWWYGRPVSPHSRSIFLRLLEGREEVARLRLGDDLRTDDYADVPLLGASALEIQYIEVHGAHRGRGLGTAAIKLLHERYPDRRLVAFSAEAEHFWSSLGWRRHLHVDPDLARRQAPLFIEPQP